MSIGEFARACGLSVKAIRHYDAVGLLTPARTDPQTGYRFYTADQLETAQAIAELRPLGIPLNEIRRALRGGPEGIRAELVRHQRRREARQSRTAFTIHQLDHRLKGENMARGKPYPISADDDLALGAWCFNRTWDLIEKEDRTPAEDEEMLVTAFAARYHWSRVGTPVNFARGEWQIARVYGVLGRHQEAVRHSRRCLEITESASLRDFDLAFAYEGMARSLALAGNTDEARGFAARAATAGTQIAEEEDRQLFMGDLATLPLA